jgi:hypothetical protein
MNYFKRGMWQVIALFFLSLFSGFFVTFYLQIDQYFKQWLVIMIILFMIELLAISNSLQMRKALISNFGILPENSADLFSSLYKLNQKKTWPEWNKVNFTFLLVISFIGSFWVESFLFEFNFLKIDTYLILIQSTSLTPWLILFSMIIISLFFVELVILIYLCIFLNTLKEKNFQR